MAEVSSKIKSTVDKIASSTKDAITQTTENVGSTPQEREGQAQEQSTTAQDASAKQIEQQESLNPFKDVPDVVRNEYEIPSLSKESQELAANVRQNIRTLIEEHQPTTGTDEITQSTEAKDTTTSLNEGTK